MIVICKTASSKSTVKGAKYEVLKLSNKRDPSNSKWFFPRVIIEIKDGVNTSLSVKNFTQLDGTPLPEENYTSPKFDNIPSWKDGYIDDDNMVKKGEYVIYKLNLSKSLVNGSIYKISDVKVNKGRWSSDIYIKIDGQSRWLSSRSFRKLSLREARDINLKEVLEQETGVAKIDLSIRKIDRLSEIEKTKILVSTIVQSMLDVNRNNMTILEWAINKVGKQYDINEDDLNQILSKSIKTIVKSLE